MLVRIYFASSERYGATRPSASSARCRPAGGQPALPPRPRPRPRLPRPGLRPRPRPRLVQGCRGGAGRLRRWSAAAAAPPAAAAASALAAPAAPAMLAASTPTPAPDASADASADAGSSDPWSWRAVTDAGRRDAIRSANAGTGRVDANADAITHDSITATFIVVSHGVRWSVEVTTEAQLQELVADLPEGMAHRVIRYNMHWGGAVARGRAFSASSSTWSSAPFFSIVLGCRRCLCRSCCRRRLPCFALVFCLIIVIVLPFALPLFVNSVFGAIGSRLYFCTISATGHLRNASS